MSHGDDVPVGEPTLVDHALDQLLTSFDHLLKVVGDGGLDGYDDGQLVGFLQSFEGFRNRLSLVDHRVIADGDRRGVAAACGQPSMRQVLVQLVRLSFSEASRRVLAAEACGQRVSALGEVLEPARPQLAVAQQDGTVSAEQVDVILRALAKVDRPGIAPQAVAEAEAILTGFAASFGGKDLRLLAERTVDAIDPDGAVPDETLQADRRHLSMRRCRDGMYAGEFRLTGAAGAKLTALLQPLARPRLDTLDGADPEHVDRADSAAQALGRSTLVDSRTFGQRLHDALEEVCDRTLRAGEVPGVGGTPATVIVTIAHEDLQARLGFGTTTDGVLLPARQVLELASEAEVIPTVLNQAGAVLTLGRSRRIASTAQTLALIARDHGCSFPGCGRGPEWCERHHIREWVDGGPTDLDNLTLLCRYHHHNFASRGWTCQLSRDRLPEWRPPRWLDPGQQPLRNSRVRAELHKVMRRRGRADAATSLRGGSS